MIVGLVGYKGSGKSEVAKVFERIGGYERMKFAGGLKEMLRAYLRYVGVPERQIEDMIEGSEKELPSHYLAGRTPRHAMQTLGTEWGRHEIGTNLWIDGAMSAALQHDRVVFDDVRFWNEADAIRSHGGVLIRVERESAGWTDAHPSEADIMSIECDHCILNDRGLPELAAFASTILIGLAADRG